MPNDFVNSLEVEEGRKATPQVELTFYDIARIVANSWRATLIFTVVFIAAAIAYCRLATPLYKAEATVVAANFGDGNKEINSFMGFMKGGAEDLYITKTSTVLNSYELAKILVEKHGVDRLLDIPENIPLPISAKISSLITGFADKKDDRGNTRILLVQRQLQNILIDQKTGTSASVFSFEYKDRKVSEEFLRMALQEADAFLRRDQYSKTQLDVDQLNARLSMPQPEAVRNYLYQELSNKLVRLSSLQSEANFNLRIISPSYASPSPSSPKPLIVLPISVIIGVFVGILSGFVREFRRNFR